MATAAYPGTTNGQIGIVQLANFIPELWSDEIIASYEKKLVMAPLVRKMPMVGKKGDTMHIPKPTRGAATAKAAATGVTLIYNTEDKVDVVVNQHWEYSRMIEDIASIQALSSHRGFYTQDAGYALATRVDTFLHGFGNRFQSGTNDATYDKAVIGSDGSTLYTGTNEAALTDAAVRRVIQTLDDADVPMDSRYLVIPPVAANTVRGIARYTEQAFIGSGDAIRTGEIANLYGVKVFVSTNTVTATGDAKIALLFQSDAIVLAEQLRPRVQTQYKQEYLADLMTADMIFGGALLRAEGGVAIALAA
jgi:N4-gp56 family major capsid protein